MMGFMIDCRLLHSVAKSGSTTMQSIPFTELRSNHLRTAPDSLTGWVEGGMA